MFLRFFFWICCNSLLEFICWFIVRDVLLCEREPVACVCVCVCMCVCVCVCGGCPEHRTWSLLSLSGARTESAGRVCSIYIYI
jgi:hypothetical protein